MDFMIQERFNKSELIGRHKNLIFKVLSVQEEMEKNKIDNETCLGNSKKCNKILRVHRGKDRKSNSWVLSLWKALQQDQQFTKGSKGVR